MVKLIRSCTSQPGMRPVAVVPGEVEHQLLLKPGEAVRNEDQPSRAFGSECSHAALDHRQASMLVERSEPELNSPTPTPPSESSRNELLAPVGNEVPGCLPHVPGKPPKEFPNRCRRGLRAIDREFHQTPGEVIDGGRYPPAKRPDLRQSEGKPRSPEPERGGNGREIDVPEVIGVPGGDDVSGFLGSMVGSWPFPVAKHPTYRRWGEVKTGAGENLSEFHLPEGRTEDLEAPHEVGDEIGELAHRLGQADQCVRALFIETPHPGGDGEWAHEEDAGGLGEGPPTSGAKFEDRQPLRCRIMG